MSNQALLIILGNQLFPIEHVRRCDPRYVLMAEDMGLCTYERHHQQKIVLFLAAMRAYADELRNDGFNVIYHVLEQDAPSTYEDRLVSALEQSGCTSITHFEIEDKPMETRIVEFARRYNLERQELSSPMFLCSRKQFHRFVNGRSTVRMADFYKSERIRLQILVDGNSQPVGGQWSFDADNRKKLPKNLQPEKIKTGGTDKHVQDVIPLVSRYFSDHPGDAQDFWWPTTRKAAKAWLRDFLLNRLTHFGPYEDAISQRSDTVFHSALSPCMNLGLLTPDEVISGVISHGQRHNVPLQSIEGFVRQVIGWREFVRGIYQNFGDVQHASNFWSHNRELTSDWYEGTTGIPPLDDAIDTAQRLGWTHHIPRLMVVANLMTLCEIEPRTVHRWFMEMYVDSSEWVMGPNVYGMGIFSDGGIFASKPYICGSNYLLKMSDYKKAAWCDVVDGLYWRFIAKHRDFFSANPRLALMPRALDRLSNERRDRIFAAAENFLERMTVEKAAG